MLTEEQIKQIREIVWQVIKEYEEWQVRQAADDDDFNDHPELDDDDDY
jgi:hypothetical protein